MKVRIRHAARALILCPQDCVLLMRLNMPRGRVWLTPGGGLQPGEAVLDGLRRELREETGRADLRIGAEIWHRTIHYSIGEQPCEQHERIFLVRSERFEPHIAHMPDEPERDWFEAFHWWSVADIRASGERFGPRQIGTLVETLLRDGVPARPLRIER